MYPHSEADLIWEWAVEKEKKTKNVLTHPLDKKQNFIVL